jgi:hypothetical protein
MNHNFTRTTPITAEQLAEREKWYSEQMAEANRVNEVAMQAQAQIRASEFQNDLVAKTLLTLPQLEAVRSWLFANPIRQEAAQKKYEEIR